MDDENGVSDVLNLLGVGLSEGVRVWACVVAMSECVRVRLMGALGTKVRLRGTVWCSFEECIRALYARAHTHPTTH